MRGIEMWTHSGGLEFQKDGHVFVLPPLQGLKLLVHYHEDKTMYSIVRYASYRILLMPHKRTWRIEKLNGALTTTIAEGTVPSDTREMIKRLMRQVATVTRRANAVLQAEPEKVPF